MSLLSEVSCTAVLWLKLNSLNPGPLQMERTRLGEIHETEDSAQSSPWSSSLASVATRGTMLLLSHIRLSLDRKESRTYPSGSCCSR